jgi:hypothetical protein
MSYTQIRGLVLALVAALGFLGAPAARLVAQDSPRLCFDCEKTGFKPCTSPECKKWVCPLFKEPHKCTKTYAFTCCRGQKVVPCKLCGHLGPKSQWDAEMESRQAWMDEMTKVNKDLKVEMEHIQTENFLLHFNIEKVKIKDVTYDKLASTHLYAQRLEELMTAYKKYLGEPFKYCVSGHWVIYIGRNPEERNRMCATVNSANRVNAVHGPDSHFITAFDREDMNDDEDLHANVTHLAAEMILMQGSPVATRKYPGWLSEGFAHWIEAKLFESIRNRCTAEVPDKDKWKEGPWEGKVFPLVRKGKEPKFASFHTQSTKELSAMMHWISWSFVDFLMAEHQPKMGDLVRTITEGADTSAAFQKVFGWSLAQVHEEWRKYVEKAYGTK